MTKVNLTPEPGTPCRYSARHQAEGVPAVVIIDMGVIGEVPCCQQCRDFYRRMKG